jgi:hypothetical protein
VAIELHTSLSVVLLVQLTPEFDEVQILPLASTAARKVPSLLEVIDFQNLFDAASCLVQLAPEFDEVQMLPPCGIKFLKPADVVSVAASLVPSLLVAIAVQKLLLADRFVQLLPALVEVQIRPPVG